ncbi:hypothetical protein BKA65DRAFT_485735 [Rhexocercosporidium sp. MPI-PUGE-AT-0058]|nr:hypothetical protein BKA65DRAFT_485735 [Rhexocercosporidium sp. MPI-PUGE-AT-0058]
MPPLVLKRANAYIYFDIAYAILANPLLELYASSGRLKSLFRLPVNRLFVKLDPRAAGFQAEIHCAHIRKHASQSQDESFGEAKTHKAPASEEGSAISSLIRYETVFIGTYDLKNRSERTAFAGKYFDIQCMAHLRAAQHEEVMKAAMDSTRDIALTELSDLAFVHTVQGGEITYGMVDEGGKLFWEGEENGVGCFTLRMFCLFITVIGPILSKDDFFIPAGAWCWMNESHETERLYLHYLWIFVSQLGSLVIYISVFLFLQGRLANCSKLQNVTIPSSSTSIESPTGPYKVNPTTTTTIISTGHNTFAVSGNRILRTARYMVVYRFAYVFLTLPRNRQ